MLLLWILFVTCIYVSCFLVFSLQPCGHLLGKGWPLGFLVCDVFCVFVTLPCGVLGQVWNLIVLIPDLCLLTYLHVDKQFFSVKLKKKITHQFQHMLSQHMLKLSQHMLKLMSKIFFLNFTLKDCGCSKEPSH